jgi:hypothetical protein
MMPAFLVIISISSDLVCCKGWQSPVLHRLVVLWLQSGRLPCHSRMSA